MKHSRLFPFLAWLMLMVFSVGLRAQTAPEPTVRQIYETASRGDLNGANTMIDQVIQRHPESAKAHYVKAELAVRGRDAATAQSALRTAERLAPGLPFVRPEAVTALRTQIAGLSSASAAPPLDQRGPDTRSMGAPPADVTGQERSPGGGFSLGGLIVPALLAIGLVAFMRRRRGPRSTLGGNMARAPEAYSGDRFGRNTYARTGGAGRWPQPPMQPGGMHPHQGPYPSQYPGHPMGYPQRGGMGGSIARGIGTGLAIGAGAAVAHEIGQRMFDRDGNEIAPGDAANSQIAQDAGLGGGWNEDRGGQDFGIQDHGGGWDDAGGGGFGDVGGDDWNT